MLENGSIETGLVPGPVEYATLRAGSGPNADLPIVLWLHGGGGSRRFLETCRAQFVSCWRESSLPDLIAVTPSAGWSFYLDRLDGSELWETFLFSELIPHIRAETGSTNGPLIVGGISIGAVASLRLAFKRPDLVDAVVAVEPTLEAAFYPDDVPRRDRVGMPDSVRSRLFGDPVNVAYWRANHPPVLATENAAAIAASNVAIYLECGDQDVLHAQFGTEVLHRRLFDIGLSHEYRLVKGGDHVGPTVGPRLIDALRFVGRVVKPTPDHNPDGIVEVETFASQVRDLEETAGYVQIRQVEVADYHLTVRVHGEGPSVVLLPSLGRGSGDFADLSARLARSGYCAISPEPRGMAGSQQGLAGLTLEHFADDVAAVITAIGAPAVVVGHDFGGQVAQMAAHLHPELVSSLVLLAVPGPIPAKPEPATALRRIFVPELSHEEHLEALALALFAEGNDPVVWADGWFPSLAFAQAEAERHLPPEELWSKLQREALVIQPEKDLVVVPENAERMARELGGLVKVVTVPNAGHALLPEQPEAVAAAILSWLRLRS